MTTRTKPIHEVSATVLELVETALRQVTLSGLCDVLRCIAQAANACGCILWEVIPGSELERSRPKGFFVLAAWFPDEQNYALHDLPLTSVTGEAVIHQVTINVTDVETDARVYKGDGFLSRNHLNAMCSLPFALLDGALVALNLYRKDSVAFCEEEVAAAEHLVSLVPPLYQAIRDKVSLSLLKLVDERLHQAERDTSQAPSNGGDSGKVILTICKEISNTFQCLETSIFLENRIETPGQYRMMATTWPGEFKKSVYRRTDEDGLTGYVLNHAIPVKILDLAHFKRDEAVVLREYPELKWSDALGLASAVRAFRNLCPTDPLPPLSFMAVPVVMGADVLGVIRCCVANVAPYYFAQREVILLQLVAARLSQYWGGWLTRREMEEENQSWRALVESVSKMNGFAHRELSEKVPDERRIFAEGLRVAESVIPAAQITDVRLLDENTDELYFAATYGPAWEEGTLSEIQRRKQRRFPVTGAIPRSAGEHVFQSGEVYEVVDVRTDKYYSETFPNTRRMIVAPISSEKKIFGVLDIRGTGDRGFPRHARTIAKLLGQQLGLYHHLALTIRRLHQATAELNDAAEKQTMAFENLQHQFKSPVIQAHARVQSLLTTDWHNERLLSALRAIRGLCGKARRVGLNVKLFADLAKQGELPLLGPDDKTPLTYDDLIKMLIEAADDYQVLSDPRFAIRFDVDRKSFDVRALTHVKADMGLLEQALSNVIDNAAKYSLPETTVKIYGGLTGSGRFHLSVVNKGIKLHSFDINRCLERGWRGDEAQLVTGEGSGIGLWIVDHVMKAHGGSLVIKPTTDEGLTEVKLVLPTD